jgi:hypothetical protein
MTTAPTTTELQALITALQAQVATLMTATPAGPTIATAAIVIFAETPQTLNPDNLLDYLIKRGSSIYEQGRKPLDDKALTNVLG